MSRLFFVPQLPIKMRYQEWWYNGIPNALKEYFDEVIILGEFKALPKTKDKGGNFSNTEEAIIFEMFQIDEFLNSDIGDDDYLLHGDLSFPGIFHNVLHHKQVRNAFAVCHATSKNAYDYFTPIRSSKWLVESGCAKMYKKVFVASEYHKDKLGWDNVVNLGALPNPPFKGQNSKNEYHLVSVSRPSIQKRTKAIENVVEKRYGKIITAPPFSKWYDYYNFLGKSECMLITSKEECYGYQVIDAVINNCIPVAPRNFSYPELLPDEYLYSNMDELFEILRWTDGKGIKGLKTPELLNQSKIDNFYQNLVVEIMNAV